MVRLVDSQCIEPLTFGSLLVNVTSHDTEVLALTVKLLLLVVSEVSEVALVSVFVYSCPLTAVPPVVPQVPSVYSCADSVPFNGAPLTGVTVAMSLGSQVWPEVLMVVSLTVKHSPELASLEPV
jgi:hypothetical protein